MERNELSQEPVFDSEEFAFDKGLGFFALTRDHAAQGHLAAKRGRVGEWIAGLWLQHHGCVVTFGAAGSSHDLIATDIQTEGIQSVQVKTTTKRLERGTAAFYRWNLKASPSQTRKGNGRWDASKSNRLILVALGMMGQVWVIDSEIHALSDWKQSANIRFWACDLECGKPFVIIGGDLMSTMFMQEDLDTEITPSLFD